MLSVGDSKVSKLYIGDSEYKKAYLGDALVLDNSIPSYIAGIDWHDATMPENCYPSYTVYAGNKFFAPGNGYIGYSDDGTNWHRIKMPANRGFSVYSDVAYGNGIFIAIPSQNNYSDYYPAISSDGITWTISSKVLFSQSTCTIAFGNGIFVVGDNKTKTIKRTTDGNSWETSSPLKDPAKAIVYGNDRFVAFCTYYSSAYSMDGITWIAGSQLPFNTSFTTHLNLTYGNGKFVGVGGTSLHYSNIAIYSTDGINWQQVEIPKGKWNGLAYGEGKFVAVEYDSNRVIYSSDAVTWHEGLMNTSSTWQGMAYGKGKFVTTDYGQQVSYSYSGKAIS